MRGAAALAIAGRQLQITNAFITRAVVVRIGRDTGLQTGLHKSVRQRLRVLSQFGHMNRTIAAAVGGITPWGMLKFLEIRQQFLVAPALATQPTPVVKLGRVAAHINHAVDRTGATGQFATRPVDLLIFHLRLRLGLELPNVVRVLQYLADAQWHFHPEVVLPGLTRFEQ